MPGGCDRQRTRTSCDHPGMTNDPPALGQGALSASRVIGHAVGMLQVGFARIAVVALVLFVPPSLLAAFVHHSMADFEQDPKVLLGLGVIVSVAIASALRLLGPVVFAGYLDEAVGAGFFHGHQRRMGDVLRSLPWGRLLVADLIVMGGTVLLASALIIPGLVFFMLVSLVGPVLVQEQRGLVSGFRRAIRLSLTSLPLMAGLVVIPTVLELVLHEVVFQALHGAGLGVEVAAEWLLAAALGGSIGLIEVALATELMARNPDPAQDGEAADAVAVPQAD